jgi:hypothetical protein
MKYLSILLIILIAGCNSGKHTTNENNSSRSIEELDAAPEKILIDTKNYILSADVWRDLMPRIDKNKSGLFLIAKLKTEDGTDIAENLIVKKAWIVRNKDIWEIDSVTSNVLQEGVMEIKASNGPQWKPQEKVNVIIEIHRFRSVYLLQAKNILINAVY